MHRAETSLLRDFVNWHTRNFCMSSRRCMMICKDHTFQCVPFEGHVENLACETSMEPHPLTLARIHCCASIDACSAAIMLENSAKIWTSIPPTRVLDALWVLYSDEGSWFDGERFLVNLSIYPEVRYENRNLTEKSLNSFWKNVEVIAKLLSICSSGENFSACQAFSKHINLGLCLYADKWFWTILKYQECQRPSFSRPNSLSQAADYNGSMPD